MPGRLDLIIGCMFAGKTSEFISRYRKYKRIGKDIFVINHTADTRYGKGVVSSHDRDRVKCKSVTNLNELSEYKDYVDADIVMIDEAQFFDDLVDFVSYGMDIHNKHFIVCGLSGDCYRRPFGEILNLIPLCSNITHLKAVCSICNERDAIYSMRLSDDKCQLVVGNEDKYIPVCEEHYKIKYFREDKNSDDTKTATTSTIKRVKSSGSVGDAGSEWMLWGC